MKTTNKLYNLSICTLYILITLVWLITYIFIGEDLDLNTSETYLSFMNFTYIYLFLVILFISTSKQVAVKIVITFISFMLTPILIAGYMGSATLINGHIGLFCLRKNTLLLHILVYAIGVFNIYRHYKIK